MKRTTKTPNGTSFHGDVFSATVTDIYEICGLPDFLKNNGRDKVNFEWFMETEDGDVFTIYDWKMYRRISETEIIEWHIGGHSAAVTAIALNEISEALTHYNQT